MKTGGQAPIGSEDGSDFTLADTPMTREEIDYEKLRNITASNGLSLDVEIKREIGKIVMILNNRIIFNFKKSIITPKGVEYLKLLSPILKEGPGIIELRGYASNAECLLEPDPDYAGIYLSTKRGLALFHFLTDTYGIPASNVIADGFGIITKHKLSPANNTDHYPQIEIIVDYRREVPYRLRVKKNGRSIGF